MSRQTALCGETVRVEGGSEREQKSSCFPPVYLELLMNRMDKSMGIYLLSLVLHLWETFSLPVYLPIIWGWKLRAFPWIMSVLHCARSCPTLRSPMDYSPPGSSARGIFPARILEWVAISSSSGSSRPRDQTCVSCIGRQVLNRWVSWEVHLWILL